MLSLRSLARRAPALALAATVLVSTLGAPSPALAQNPNPHDHRNGGPPSARVQVILHQVKILDDRDWGDGEFNFWFEVICHTTSTPCLMGTGLGGYAGYSEKFSAATNETHSVNRVLPVDDPNHEWRNPRWDASPEAGYPLREGHEYHLLFGMEERDKLSDYEQMGRVRLVLKPENGWGLGTHTIRSSRHDDGAGDGDYEVTFEVRRLMVSDLRPINLSVSDLPGSPTKRVCSTVQNITLGLSGPVEMLLRIDDQAPFDARTTVPGLTGLTSAEACIETELPASGQHKLSVIVDPANKLLEYNEANNTYDQPYTAPAQQQPPATPKPTTSQPPAPASDAGRADLVVSTIKVNGQTPDAKDDCKDGKNAVAVVVTNAGTATEDKVSVRLQLDDDELDEASVAGLEAGQEREVRFGNVRLKKGEHRLAATVDAKGAVAESNEENNERAVTARCTEGD